MTTDTSTQTGSYPPSPPHGPASPASDTLYRLFEDTIGTIEELVFPVEPDICSSLLCASGQEFLEHILDQLIRWGVDIYGRHGSLRAVTGTIVGDCIEQILENMKDELEMLLLRAGKGQKSAIMIGRSLRQMLRQALVNLRGFHNIICTTHEHLKAEEIARQNGVDGEVDEGEITESVESLDGTGD